MTKCMNFHCPFCPTEDELVSLDDLQEKVAEHEDYVQSTDVAAMQSKQPHALQFGSVSLHMLNYPFVIQSCRCLGGL